MYADAVLAVILKVGAAPEELSIDSKYTMIMLVHGMISSKGKEGIKELGKKFPDRLLRLMREMFGVRNVNWCLDDEKKMEIYVDSVQAVLDPATLTVETKDDGLQHLIATAAKRLHAALTTALT